MEERGGGIASGVSSFHDTENQEETLSTALAFFDGLGSDEFGKALGEIEGDLDLLVATDIDSTSTESTSSSTLAALSVSSQHHMDNNNTVFTSKRARIRTNPREELLYLRTKVSELESKVVELKQQDGEKANCPPDRSTIMKTVWAEMASRQYQQRQQSEMKNIRLRMMLEDQIKLAKSLERLLCKQNKAELVPHTSQLRSIGQLDQSSIDEMSTLTELLESLRRMYPHVDKVLEDPRFQQISHRPLRDIQLRSDGSGNASIEIVESRIVPFKFEMTADALWKLFTNSCHDSIKEEVHVATEDTVSKSFEGIVETARARAVVHGKLAAVRHVEADRAVILVGHIAEPVEVSEKPIHGAAMRHRGWIVIQRGQDDSAWLRSYHVGVPKVYEASRDQAQTVGALTDFVLATVETNLDAGLMQIENYLFAMQTRLNQGQSE